MPRQDTVRVGDQAGISKELLSSQNVYQLIVPSIRTHLVQRGVVWLPQVRPPLIQENHERRKDSIQVLAQETEKAKRSHAPHAPVTFHPPQPNSASSIRSVLMRHIISIARPLASNCLPTAQIHFPKAALPWRKRQKPLQSPKLESCPDRKSYRDVQEFGVFAPSSSARLQLQCKDQSDESSSKDLS